MKLKEEFESSKAWIKKLSLLKKKGIPIGLIMIAPFILHILATVGIIGYVALSNEQKTFKNLATESQTAIGDRLISHLDNYLETHDVSAKTEDKSRVISDVNTREQNLQVLLLSLAFLLPTSLWGLAICCRISRNVDSLSQATSAIALGDAKQVQIDIGNINELLLLAESFNQMASGLHKSHRELKQARQEILKLKKAQEILEATSYSKSSLLADMSHELRSPLNGILGFTQIMQRDRLTTRSQQENLAVISRSGKQLLSVINDVLDLSKVEANRLNLEDDSFDFHRWLDSIAEIFKSQADDEKSPLLLLKDQSLPQYIRTDERRLHQVLINLIDYSLKFTQAGCVTLRVSSMVTSSSPITNTQKIASVNNQEQMNICFEVENTECSISSAELSALFDPWIKTERKRKFHEHSTLSLPISRKLARLMGGDVTVQSNSQQGVVFKLNIKAQAGIVEKVKIQPQTNRIIGLEPDKPNYRILVVDDSKTSRQIMLELLEPLGFEVQEAINGQEAVDVWLKWQPHMIWMDVRMPVMNGYEATEQIKSHPQTQRTSIVALTASTLEFERSLFQSAGCDDFVGKPFTESVIFDKIAQHLGVRYVYESPNSSTEIDDISNQNFKLTANSLQVMSSKWLTELQQAAVKLDKHLLTELLEQIPEQHSCMAQALQNKIDNFDFDEIIDLVGRSNSQEKSFDSTTIKGI
jgi:signal transduction histidine kinase/DNA-binding response OmpR family regulator